MSLRPFSNTTLSSLPFRSGRVAQAHTIDCSQERDPVWRDRAGFIPSSESKTSEA